MKKLIIVFMFTKTVLFTGFCKAEPLTQPSQAHSEYLTEEGRKELLLDKDYEKQESDVSWLVIVDRDNTPVYEDYEGEKQIQDASFLDVYSVFEKKGSMFRIGAQNESSPIGWISGHNLLLIPEALKSPKTRASRKVVFAEDISRVRSEDLGRIVLYDKPDEDSEKREIPSGLNPLYFVYKWVGNEDGKKTPDYALIGYKDSVRVTYAGKKENLAKELLGWVSMSKFTSWDSRQALLPEEGAQGTISVFTDETSLINYYTRNLSLTALQDFVFYKDARTIMDGVSGRNFQPFYLIEEQIHNPAPHLIAGTVLDGKGLKVCVMKHPRGLYGSGGVNLDNRISMAEMQRISFLFQEMKEKLSNVEIVFLVDATRSMDNYLKGVVDTISILMSKTAGTKSSDDDFTFFYGGAVYRDYVDGDQVFSVKTIRKNHEDVMNWFSSEIAGSHDDDRGECMYPEALYHGISETVKQVGWSKDRIKLLVIIGDAGNCPSDKRYCEQELGALLANEGINIVVLPVTHDWIDEDAEKTANELLKTQMNNIKRAYISEMRSRFSTIDKDGNNVLVVDPVLLEDLFKILGTFDSPAKVVNEVTKKKVVELETAVVGIRERLSALSHGDKISIGKEHPIVLMSIEKVYGKNWRNELDLLKLEKARIYYELYAFDKGPLNNSINWKPVYLYQEKELKNLMEAYATLLSALNNTRNLLNLWKDGIYQIFGQVKPPVREAYGNTEAEIMRGYLFSRETADILDLKEDKLTHLVGKKPESKSNSDNSTDLTLDVIRNQLTRKHAALKNLLENKKDNWFGPDNSFIYLYQSELP